MHLAGRRAGGPRADRSSDARTLSVAGFPDRAPNHRTQCHHPSARRARHAVDVEDPPQQQAPRCPAGAPDAAFVRRGLTPGGGSWPRWRSWPHRAMPPMPRRLERSPTQPLHPPGLALSDSRAPSHRRGLQHRKGVVRVVGACVGTGACRRLARCTVRRAAGRGSAN
jgi:hypothetical protein